MGSLVSSSSEDFDQWAFAIDRRRHVPHGKTDLLSDSSVRSDGSALTMLLCSASGISVTYCCRTSHLSMWLERRGFADLDAIPWGDLGSASRDERRAEPPVRRALIGRRSTDHPAEDDPLRFRPLRRRA